MADYLQNLPEPFYFLPPEPSDAILELQEPRDDVRNAVPDGPFQSEVSPDESELVPSPSTPLWPTRDVAGFRSPSRSTAKCVMFAAPEYCDINLLSSRTEAPFQDELFQRAAFRSEGSTATGASGFLRSSSSLRYTSPHSSPATPRRYSPQRRDLELVIYFY